MILISCSTYECAKKQQPEMASRNIYIHIHLFLNKYHLVNVKWSQSPSRSLSVFVPFLALPSSLSLSPTLTSVLSERFIQAEHWLTDNMQTLKPAVFISSLFPSSSLMSFFFPPVLLPLFSLCFFSNLFFVSPCFPFCLFLTSLIVRASVYFLTSTQFHLLTSLLVCAPLFSP